MWRRRSENTWHRWSSGTLTLPPLRGGSLPLPLERGRGALLAPRPRSGRGRGVRGAALSRDLLLVPVDRVDHADDALEAVVAVGHGKEVLTRIGVGRFLEELGLDLLQHLLAVIGVARGQVIEAELLHLLVAGPAEPVLLVAAGIDGRIDDRVHHGAAGPGRREDVPAAMVL